MALFHVAEPARWAAAQEPGAYAESTRGMSLEQVGFIHAAEQHQVPGVLQRFYADVEGPLLLLEIDEKMLTDRGIEVRREPPAPGVDELFPHVYGAVPVETVAGVTRLEPPFD